jgi:putative transposase
MAELEKWLTLEICEQYHRRIHRGIHRSPLAAWEESVNGANAIVRCLPDQPEQFTISFLPFCERKLRRDGLHLFNIRYWDNVLPSMVQLGTPVIVRYDPRNLAKVFVLASDHRYYPIPYADLSLPPITLWEQRAALTKLHSEGNNAPAEAAIFQAVVDQRALIAQAASKTRSARRQSQRRKDAGVDMTGRPRSEASAVDYSQPVLPSEAEVWDV